MDYIYRKLVKPNEGRLNNLIHEKFLYMVDICKKCGLPDDLCACGELEKEETRIVVRLEKRRFNKDTTMIEGFNPKLTDLVKIVKQLKNRFACGGTTKEGYIMLQGDHRDNIKKHLTDLGFKESSIEVH